jgi:hypothetical protein
MTPHNSSYLLNACGQFVASLAMILYRLHTRRYTNFAPNMTLLTHAFKNIFLSCEDRNGWSLMSVQLLCNQRESSTYFSVNSRGRHPY